VVADHSDGFEFFPLVAAADPVVMADPQGRQWHDMIASGQGAAAAVDIIRNFGAGTISKAILPVPGTKAYRNAWHAAIKAAEEANAPGRFTAFIGFEWTSNTRRTKVYDVAWSGNRRPGPDGKLPSVGSTVDLANATWTNTIGAPELIAVWKDPAFDAAQRAFYYVRVLEIPTPRWTAYDAKRFGIQALPGTRMTITERAYTSPIWYTPSR
jgi:hypothetical protein